MSAIYQRARPIRWDQVVGQEHVKDVLKAALEQGRVGHAYLFSGPRGVGKTTTARLIAMTANCTQPGIKPCGECESCLSVRAGNHPDVLEIDAASNNSVDDVRELREKVGLSAMRGGKKIYILDEAHMMSRAAFNALLKTLEEPPEHVIFILATTEPEKIIPTILSRCQHYRFRRLTPEEIGGKLAGIALKEGVNAEPEALQLIGRLADGAMRDGESLLERMLAAGQDVTRAGVETALGLPPGEQMRSMAAALVQADAGGLLEGAAGLYRAGYAARTVVEGLVTALGQALHAELGIEGAGAGRLEGADVPRLLRLQAALDAQDSRFARGADLQSLELALTHALIAGDGTAGGSGGQSAGSSAAPGADVTQRLARLEKELRDLRASGVPVQAARPLAQPVASALDEIPSFEAASRAPARPDVSAQAAPVPVSPPTEGNWADVVRLASSQTKAFLKPAQMHAQQGYVSLHYSDKNTFHAKQMVSKFDELSTLVTQVFGPVMLEIMGPTPDSSKKAQVGGKAGAQVVPAPQVIAAPQAAAASAPTRSVALNPPDEIPPFAEARDRRAGPASSAASPDFADVPGPSRAEPFSTAPLTAVRPALGTDIPEFAPARRTSTTAAPNSAAAPKATRPSLDDRAPAPLPEQHPNYQGHSPQVHSAQAPDVQSPDAQLPEAQLADEPAPEVQTRSVYIAPEPIFEEPDWDDLGLSPDMPPVPNSAAGAAPKTGPGIQSLAQSATPPAGLPLPGGPLPVTPPVQRRPAQTVRPDDVQLTPARQPQTRPVSAPPARTPTASSPTQTVASGLQDLRAHPLYQEATRMWSGRVKEVGKVKLAVKAEADSDPDMAEVLAEEELV
ncbi:DNA polymerase III subunit gamma/tau [Deinococcus altitudinis]|uniref:DNA polymerase III subunit gamma/tau n=1 Tax=Deinococcus altitudinis TaxID=468914 RepID=UPI0038912144